MKEVLHFVLSFAMLIFTTFLDVQAQSASVNINVSGTKINTRFAPPDSFVRPPFPLFTYQSYLRELTMKQSDAEVIKYDGNKKQFDCYAGVIELDFDNEHDLIHGEHIIEFIRGKYLYDASKYDLLTFRYEDNRSISFSEWGAGARFVWTDSTYVLDTIASENYSEESFEKFMLEVYSNTNTNSLVMDTKVVLPKDLNLGDILVQPEDQYASGHAVLIVDIAVNPFTGKKLYLFAQGFSPTQDVHILRNMHDPDISPWYRVQEDAQLILTAQWTFRRKHVRRFRLNANAQNVQDILEMDCE